MKGDFSRDTYDKAKHFSRVLMQQGRVQLDSDWNEQTAILLHYLRTLAADLIGPFAGPAMDGAKPGTNFKISLIEGTPLNLKIGTGRYYVDGILCENDTDVTYQRQEKSPNDSLPSQPDFPSPPSLDSTSKYLVYLDVWERYISAIEDDYIREKALGGPDTASRTKVTWQVKVEDLTNGTTTPSSLTPDEVRGNWDKWIARWQPPHLGCLKARVKRPEDSHDPCLAAPDAKYRGAENQLYRVEIHTGGEAGKEGGPTFKWSRDNGAIVTGCNLEGAELTVNNPRGFAANQWVELTNDGQELRGKPGVLVKVIKVEAEKLTLEKSVSIPSDVPIGSVGEEVWPTKVRRWDQSENGELDLVEGAIPVHENTAGEERWIELEDGIQIQYQGSADKEMHHYRTGDYWLIPARVATGDIEWPVMGPGDPKSVPPHGIRHHYAPLALLIPSNENPTDLRCAFPTGNDCKRPSYGVDGMGGAPAECHKGEDLGRSPRSTPPKRGAPSTRKPQGKRRG